MKRLLKDLSDRDLISKNFVYDSNTGTLTFLDNNLAGFGGRPNINPNVVGQTYNVPGSSGNLFFDVKAPQLTEAGVTTIGVISSQQWNKQQQIKKNLLYNPTIVRTDTSTTQASGSGLKTLSLTSQATLTIPAQASATSQASSTAQKTKQDTTTTQTSQLRSKGRGQSEFFRETGGYIIPPILASALKKKLSSKSKAISIFGIYARRKKVDRLIGKETSLDIAKIKLRRVLGSTISASGYISEIGSGKKLNIDLGMKYRKAKRDPLRIVEKRRFRLDTKSELFEIGSAKRLMKGIKRKKGKKLKWM